MQRQVSGGIKAVTQSAKGLQEIYIRTEAGQEEVIEASVTCKVSSPSSLRIVELAARLTRIADEPTRFPFSSEIAFICLVHIRHFRETKSLRQTGFRVHHQRE